MAIQKGLGKGLEALFGEENIRETPLKELDIYEVGPNQAQPRKFFDEGLLEELSENIRENGVITPITVRKKDKGYEIIAGERRWRAAKKAGLKKIPAIVLDIDEQKAYQLSMVENLQREDLNPIEEAEGFKTLIEKYGMTQEQVAKAVSKSRPAVANAVRLLELSEKILDCLKNGEITAGHGKALLSVKDEKDREELLEIIVSKSLSVRQSEDMARRMNEEKPEKSEDEESKDRLWKIYVEHVEKRLTDALGRNVSVISGARKGRVYLDFYGNEDLENLINLLCSKEQK